MGKLGKYLKTVNNSYIFTGEKAKIYVPERYSAQGVLKITSHVEVLGVFEIIVNDNEEIGLILPTTIQIHPSKIYKENKDDVDYTVLELHKGDVFMQSKTIVQKANLVYVMFVEFLANGNLPKFIRYWDIPKLFDHAQKVCGINLRVPKNIFEILYAHLYRDPKDLSKPYRLTSMTAPAVFLSLRDTAYATDSTTAKLVGSYMQDNFNSAIVNPSTERSRVEDMLRR
jgi:hypothetical protein